MIKEQIVNIFVEKIENQLKPVKYTNFSHYRMAKINKAINDSIKALNIQTELLLQRVLKLTKPYIILENKHGKPYFKDININFNIAHSNEYLLLATSKEIVGIDIEKINEKHLKVAPKLFEDSDLVKYSNNINKIIEAWTIKEAYIKLYGMTMLIDLRKIKIIGDQIIGPYGDAYFQVYRHDDYFIAVATLKRAKIILN